MRWRDRFTDFVASRIARPEFRTRASRNPLMRPVGRSSAAAVFDLCAGFVYTQTLLACVRLDVLRMVHDRPRTPGEVARLAGISTQAADMLMRAAASLQLLHARGDGTFGLGFKGAALIDNPGVCAMIEHNALLYRDLADPIEFLRRTPPNGELARFWGYAAQGDDSFLQAAETAAYSRLMTVSQEMVAEEVLGAVSFEHHRRLLDVGGGHGAFALAVARAWPRMSVAVFDLPSVVAGAAAAARAAGIDRLRCHEGDFVRDPLPEGADVISLVRVLHDHDDRVVQRLLQEAARVLPPGGMVIVAEPMRGGGAQARVADAYFGFYLRGMGRGRVRGAEEIADLMARAGFTAVQRKSTKVPLVASVLMGKRANKCQKKLT
jgi:demethylspheroidene O-methyltransferase